MWFKITFAKDGAIRSCEEVAQSFEGSDTVVYIEADSRTQAIERLRKRWKKEYRTRVYNERKSLGICTHCNELAMPGYVTCEYHREKSLEAQIKTYDKKRALGLTGDQRVPLEHDGRHAQQAEMHAARKLEYLSGRGYGKRPNGLLNLRTLLVCQANFRKLSPDDFAAWLQEQIDGYRERQTNRKGRAA